MIKVISREFKGTLGHNAARRLVSFNDGDYAGNIIKACKRIVCRKKFMLLYAYNCFYM